MSCAPRSPRLCRLLTKAPRGKRRVRCRRPRTAAHASARRARRADATARHDSHRRHPRAAAALHPKLIDLSLDRMWRILARLGHPERKLPPVIHVAGTNGKGSTIAFMRAMLEAAGKRVHVYTSPHLVRFNERFRLRSGGGRLVADDELDDALAECERVNAGEPITVFEITTAAALLLFSRHPADVLLLEVGLGGRLDATNVIERRWPASSRRSSLDHAEYLGDTLDRIAARESRHHQAAACR